MEKNMENKKELQVTVNYDDKKLEAMLYFMEEKNVTVESAMQDYLEDLYEKYVPSAMRRYLNRNDGQDKQQGKTPGKRQTAETGQGGSPVKKRGERQQSQGKEQDKSSPLEQGQEASLAEENRQGMSMSM